MEAEINAIKMRYQTKLDEMQSLLKSKKGIEIV